MDIRSQLGAVFVPRDDDGPTALRSDLAFALIMVVCTAFWGDLLGNGPKYPEYLISVLTSTLVVLPLALRRYRPMWMMSLMAVASTTQVILIPHPTWSLLAVPVACYSVARYIAGRESRLVVILGTLGAVVGPLRWVLNDPDVHTLDDLLDGFVPIVMLCWAWVLIPYLLGRRDRETLLAEKDRALAAIERYENELASREQAVRMAETTARNEIARELHDIVAHSLSVMIVQADGGRALARKRPEAATEALTTISATGREALTEMRRIVGVLRADPTETAQYQPSPGLEDLPTLVASAGCQADFTSHGQSPTVSPVVALTIYRVVQEALTNVIKHAGPQATAHVVLDYLPQKIVVTITDDGGLPTDSPVQPVPSGGFGLQGMYERVSALNGTLVTEPTGSGGWRVEATLPVTPTSQSSNPPPFITGAPQ